MITKLLPLIFGIPFFLFGVYSFALSFKMYRPKHKTEEQNARFDNWLRKYGTLTKVASIVMILNGGYDLIVRDPGRYTITRGWTPQDRELLINYCVRDSKDNGEKYPQITREYCECSMDKIIAGMTVEAYESSLGKSLDQQKKQLLPLFNDCLTRYRIIIDSVKDAAN